jgi:hypothetical protein
MFGGGPFFASPPLISDGTASVSGTLRTPFATESTLRVMNAFGSPDFSDIGVAGDSGEVASEDPPAVGVDLALEDDLRSGSFKPEVEAADAAEEAADGEFCCATQ